MSNHSSRILLVTALFAACGLATSSAREPAPAKPKPHAFASEIADFEKWDRQNAWPREPVLFVGSSSIRLWQTAEAFPDLPVINRGFGGSKISDVNHYFDRIVAKYKPRVIVFYSGDNDIANGRTPKRVFDDFQKFATRVHEQLPETQILVLSIKPSVARQKFWPKMKQANSLIAKLADEDGQLEYVDMAGPMLAGGADVPPSSFFLDDGLHLNPDGYKLWNKTLGPPLEKATKH
jgi:lysophospholipase L1-like esterase